ncbi:MAG: hypothetical protein RR085_08060 [Clostridia bacterium]
MDGKIIITAEDIREAGDYIPITEKAALAQVLARACVLPIEIKDKNGLRFPGRTEENVLAKERAVLGVFLSYYLHVKWENYKEDISAPVELYDLYMSSGLFNQLERLKGNPELRTKIFDILADYKCFCKMLNTEIFSLIGHSNDTVARLYKAAAPLAGKGIDIICGLMESLPNGAEEAQGDK